MICNVFLPLHRNIHDVPLRLGDNGTRHAPDPVNLKPHGIADLYPKPGVLNARAAGKGARAEELAGEEARGPRGVRQRLAQGELPRIGAALAADRDAVDQDAARQLAQRRRGELVGADHDRGDAVGEALAVLRSEAAICPCGFWSP